MSVRLANASERQLIPWVWILPFPLLSFLPLYRYWDSFSKFFYQGDEWDQLHQIESNGYFVWLFSFFGENFVPVFKLVWGSLLFLSDGNYHVFIFVSFSAHGVLVLLLGYLLRLWGFGLFSILFAQLVLALNYTNIELLSQSIQVSNLLSYGFLLLLLIFFFKPWLERRDYSTRLCLFLGILSALGALTFARGVLNGVVVAALGGILFFVGDPDNRRLLRPAKYILIPSLIVGLILVIGSYFNGSAFAGSGTDGASIKTHFLYQIALNPWYQQIRDLPIRSSQAILLFELNLLVIFLALKWAKDFQRILILQLLVFFVGNAMVLAVGRNHLQLEHVAGWRYQYGVLLVFAPLSGLVLEKFISRKPFRFLPLVSSFLILGFCGNWVFDHWKYYVPVWSEERGQHIRVSIENEDLADEGTDISRFEGVSNQRARELVKHFNLH